ncbi:MAG: hypothetical protein ACRDBQ_19485 [Shewanella sp.]
MDNQLNVGTLIEVVEKNDTISIKSENFLEKLIKITDNLSKIPDDLNARFWHSYFKSYLSINGFSKTLEHLNELKSKIDETTYVSIGSQICKFTGNYKNQIEFLYTKKSFSNAWIEREKVRCLTNLSRLNEATTLVTELIKIQPDLYISFALDYFWKVGLWVEMNNLSKKTNDQYNERISNYALNHLDTYGKTNFDVLSIFNTHTTDQLELQKKIFLRSAMNAVGSEGLAVNLLPTRTIQQLSGNSSAGILGASLAHLKCIETFLSSGKEYTAITESDSFIYRPISHEICEDHFKYFDFIISADTHIKDDDKGYDFSDCLPYHFSGRASGFHGYFINRKAGEKITERFSERPMSKHIDGEVIKWVANESSLKIGYMPHPVFGKAYCSIFSTRAKVELSY